ncbi:hypothetical protein SAMN05216188_101423 [Lentzea xinjiangensis]|uniref:Uncharacterized protein n=1 Tax=Lentzea xinjiangensis TaxID=402600 RepID=A0A1H9AIR6_9PSEU|nr:hypothetical protein [Lentzea xinjiangensis]SEP76672.1 hypothetical protein SAMN05216188_101423 [Lentzea xinjiangensis]
MTQESAGADAALSAVAGVAGGAIGAAVGAFRSASAFLDGLTSGPSTQSFHVNKDNVLKAGAIIQDQAEVLNRALKKAEARLDVDVDSASAGIVSANIAGLWNRRLTVGEDSYVGRIRKYVESLDGLSQQLRESAKQYGYTEEDITATFGPTK